jgi:uncharacterized repeat protein (TIGR01451 family)
MKGLSDPCDPLVALAGAVLLTVLICAIAAPVATAQCLLMGEYESVPTIFYTCGFGNVAFTVTSWVFSDQGGGNIRVVPMAGTLPALYGTLDCVDSTFTVSAVLPGDCNEIYTLNGQVVSAAYWRGTFMAEFSGAVCFDCVSQTWPVEGVMGGVGADLRLEKVAALEEVELGEALQYTLTVTNGGPVAGEQVVVRDELPAGVVYLSGGASQGSVYAVGDTVVAELGTIPAGGEVVIAIDVRVDEAWLINRAELTASSGDPDTSDNTAQTMTRIQCPTLALVPETGVRAGAALHPGQPNPFNPRTRVQYTLDAAGPVELAVYDLAGRRVRRLERAHLPAGTHEATWDGRDDRGRELPSGTYLIRLVAPGGTQSRKVMLVR